MKLRNYLTLVSIIGGLAFGAASASAHCGSCSAGDKKEHSCPAGCEKACCKEKKAEGSDQEKACCAEGCAKECCKGKEKKKES